MRLFCLDLAFDRFRWLRGLGHTEQIIQQRCSIWKREKQRPVVLLFLSGHGNRMIGHLVVYVSSCWYLEHLISCEVGLGLRAYCRVDAPSFV